MRKSITFYQIWGIPLKLHLNWFLIAGLVTWSLAEGYFPQEHPGWKPESYWIVGILTSILFFGSVLLHELGHARIAQREGVPVNSITLFIFGGIAHIAHEPDTPGSEFRIVLAGPLISLVLGVGFNFLARIFPSSPEISGITFYLSQINFLLAGFNMLPGLPLDGGRILRSLFWKWKGNFVIATRWATHTGMGVALLFVLGGVLLMALGNYFNGLWVASIGWYLGIASRSSYQQISQEEGGEAKSEQSDLVNMVPSGYLRKHASSRNTLYISSLKVPASIIGTVTFLPRLEKTSIQVPFRAGIEPGKSPGSGINRNPQDPQA